MERIGAEAGVSKALAYNYFGNRTTLLAALLLREYPAFRGTEAHPVDESRTFEEIVAETTGSYIRHVVEKGVLLQRLMAEPTVVAGVSQHHLLGRDATAAFFGAQMARDHGVAPEIATRAADILMGVTGAAGRVVDARGSDIEEMTRLVTRIIMAAVRELAPPQMTDERPSTKA